MKKFTKKVGVFVLIICLSFCFGGCTIFPSSGSDWPDGQKPEYQRPAQDKDNTEAGTPPEHEEPPAYNYYDEEYYEGYSDTYSGIITAYMPSVREEGAATQEYLQARAKFNRKVSQQYAVLSEYVLYSLLGKYGGSTVDVNLTFDVEKSGVAVANVRVQSVSENKDYALFSTLGAIERSIDGVILSPSNPSTILDSESAEIVPNLNINNAWLCNLGIGGEALGADYNANYIAKYKEFLQIRLMEEMLGVSTKTTLGVYNAYTPQVKSMAIAELAKKVPNLGLVNDSVLASRIQSIIKDEIIGSAAMARSTSEIAVQEKYVWSVNASNVQYSVGEVMYQMATIVPTKQDGTDYVVGGSTISIVDTNSTSNYLYDTNGEPVLVSVKNKYNQDVTIQAREGNTYTLDSGITYDVGEIVYTTNPQMQTVNTSDGEKQIAATMSDAERLYYPNGDPILVDIDLNGTDVTVHVVKGTDYTLDQANLPLLGDLSFTRERDINNNGVIDVGTYNDAQIFGYDYNTDVSTVVNGMLEWAESMPKADSREYISIDAEEYYSPMDKPNEGDLADITHMQYQDYTSVIVYNKVFAFPWLLGLSIQSKENLVIDVYIRARKTFVDQSQQQTVTQVLKLGTMHTDSSKHFGWDGDVDPQDSTVDYDNLVANNQIWNICLEFIELLPEVEMTDMLPNSDAYIDEDGILQYSINDIDFSKDKFKDYKYLYYMQTQGMTPPSVSGKVLTEVVDGAATNSQEQGYYEGEYDRFVATNKLTGTASDNREINFSQELVVYNDTYSQEDYIEIIFDVKNKNEVSDSTFKFYLEQYPLTNVEEE